jgi:terminase small subunit / prophage DNA-packing protein
MKKNQTETVGASELAALLLVSRKTIAEWAATGVVVRVGHGRYDLRESVRGFAKHMRERDRGGDVAAVASVATERARLLSVQRKRAEHEFARECGNLISADEFGEAMTTVCRGPKVHFMQVPSRVAGAAPHLTHDDVERVKEAVWNALGEVANMPLTEVRALAAEATKEIAPP